MKTEVIPFKSFMDGTWNQKPEVHTAWEDIVKLCIGAGAVLAITLPDTAEAAVAVMAGGADNTFDKLHKSIMGIFDSGVVLVLIFAGACWCLQHRGRAIELTIGTASGYLLARHAVDIRDFLRGI